MTTKEALTKTFELLYKFYGPQGWWPAASHFEMMVGAVLTQNTSWRNAEIALFRLRNSNKLSPMSILELSDCELWDLIRPSGFYKNKARTLQAVACYYIKIGNSFNEFTIAEMNNLRSQLLTIRGIGQETADDIILYAAKLPSFVVDSYTVRVLGRLSIAPTNKSYSYYKDLIEQNLDRDVELWGEFHALLDTHAKYFCTKNHPKCDSCCLWSICDYDKKSA